MGHHVFRAVADLATGGLYEAGRAGAKALTPKIPTPPAPNVPTPEETQQEQTAANLKAQRAALAGQSRTILTSGLGAQDTKNRKKRLGA